MIDHLDDAELAGSTFSPDASILFVNIFGDSTGTVSPYTGNEGTTIAITGPGIEGRSSVAIRTQRDSVSTRWMCC